MPQQINPKNDPRKMIMDADEQLHQLLNLELGQQVITALAEAGGEARYVGGVIRDLLSHQPLAKNPDLDMAMDIAAGDAKTILTKAGLKVLSTGLAHGTITVFDRKDHRLKIELTSLRQDVETDGRHAVVKFTKDWRIDAARRDFTINSIYLAADGTVFDPFDGRRDLAAGRVRFIGNPEHRLAEDYLRILRFFRFFARFGIGAPDATAMQAIKAAAHQLDQISGERITKELTGLLALKSLPGLSALQETGVDRIITHRGFNLSGYEKLTQIAKDVPLMAAFAVLVQDHDRFAERLKLPNKMRQEMMYLALGFDDLNAFETEAWSKIAYQSKPTFGAMPTQQAALMLAWRYGAAAARSSQSIKGEVFHKLATWDIPIFPVQGHDLLAMGYLPGEALGEALAALEEYWIEGQFLQDKNDLLTHLATDMAISRR
jgi:tRNA nucleotidyltransferase/poly(A) polymerase